MTKVTKYSSLWESSSYAEVSPKNFAAKFAALLSLVLLVSVNKAQAEPEVYLYDKMHTDIIASWNHCGVSELTAKFPKFKGTFLFDKKKVHLSQVEVTVDVRSVTTSFQALDGNIASENFFDPNNYPYIHFVSTSVKRTGAKTAILTGDLTIHGVTKSTDMDVELVHQGEHALKWFHAAYKGDWLGFRAKATLLRSDFGLTRWAPFVSDRISLSISTALYKKRKK